MEFHFDINHLLPDEITVVDSKLHPFKAQHVKEKGFVPGLTCFCKRN